MNETLDGDFQTYKGESGGYIRENFFGKSAATTISRASAASVPPLT